METELRIFVKFLMVIVKFIWKQVHDLPWWKWYSKRKIKSQPSQAGRYKNLKNMLREAFIRKDFPKKTKEKIVQIPQTGTKIPFFSNIEFIKQKTHFKDE